MTSMIDLFLFSFRSIFYEPHVIWLDNYAHVMKVNCPSADSGWWRKAQWTVKAAITLKSLKDNKQFVATHHLDRGMPTLAKLFDSEVLDRFRKYFKRQEDNDPFFFDKSLSKEIRTIPIKPNADYVRVADEDRKFVPLAILPSNIGSNRGLLKLLMDHRIEETKNPHIPALLVDCNIYWRVMKVHFFLMFKPPMASLYPLLSSLLFFLAPLPSHCFLYVSSLC